MVNVYLAEKEMESRMEDNLQNLDRKQLLREAQSAEPSAFGGWLESFAASLGRRVTVFLNSVRSWFTKSMEEEWNR